MAVRSSRGGRCRAQAGQAMVEFALGATAFVIALLGALHFGLWMHSRHVAETAAVEGARWAAVEPADVARGEERARLVLSEGLGRWGLAYSVRGEDRGDTIEMRVSGSYRLILPIIGQEVPVRAEAEVRKEGFRSGP